jgi:ABC-type transport system involved in cytochrome c biogenesis permease subunit
VGTLYESVLFVALVVGGMALLMRKSASKSLIALIAGGLLMLAPAIEPQNETMGMLSAVLNTNFWLGVHVLTITIGYGLCLVTAALAHLALWRPGAWERPMQLSALGSLLFVTTGTFLGGVWADQSWGRFWGWDPKENGALLIVLWLIWLLHGKLGGQVGPQAYAAGMATLSIIVAIAWFGVNLLGVGLHSYGFITGIATGLVAFMAAQGLLILWLYLRAKRHAA